MWPLHKDDYSFGRESEVQKPIGRTRPAYRGWELRGSRKRSEFTSSAPLASSAPLKTPVEAPGFLLRATPS